MASRWRSRWYVGLALLAVVGVALAAACGAGDEDSGQATPAVTSTPEIPENPFPVETVGPSTTLLTYHNEQPAFSIDFPEDWQVMSRADCLADACFQQQAADGRPLAEIKVACHEGQTVDDVIAKDVAAIAKYHPIDASQATEVQIAGHPGKRWTYDLRVASFYTEQIVGYVTIGDCTWRLALVQYQGRGAISSYFDLFNRVANTLRPE